jgi:hypothetical protein
MPDTTLNDEAKRMLSNALERRALSPSGYANLIQGASTSIYLAGMLNAAAEKGIKFERDEESPGVKFDGRRIISMSPQESNSSLKIKVRLF